MKTTLLPAAIVLFVTTGAVHGQFPAAPPLPEKYKTTLRYDIFAARDVHVERYDAMIEHLQKVGFVFDPPLDKHPRTDREDPGKNQITGVLPSDSLLKVFDNPHIGSLLVIPEGMEMPADASTPVRVRLELPGGLHPDRQRELTEQVRGLLADLGFREALGYDHRGHSKLPFTRLTGTIPAGMLSTLLRDLRGYPFGWFGPRITADEIPAPLRNRHPILVTEVLPPTDLVKPYKEDPDANPPEGLEKVGDDLWRGFKDRILAGPKAMGEAQVRVEIFLAGPPTLDGPPSTAGILAAAPTLFIENQLGPLVTAVVDPMDVAALARVPEVLVIRLPRLPQGPVHHETKVKDASDEILKSTGLAALHAKGKKGKGVKIAIVDSDFRSWKAMRDAGNLPKKTRLVDLTRQYDADVYPLPEEDPARIGHGTQCAMAVALAAPEAELVLIRILGQNAYELPEVGRLLNGDTDTLTLSALRALLVTNEGQLLTERKVVLAERKAILEGFHDDTDEKREFGYLGPAFGWLFSDRAWAHDRILHLEKQEKEQEERWDRYRSVLVDIASMRGQHLVVSAMHWPSGYALGGASPVARWFDEKNRKGPIWFVPSGNTRGQAWSGIFRDEDGNGILEFASRDAKLKPGRWTQELAFLGWQTFEEKKETPDIVPVRVSLQWRETHDPDYFMRPLADRKEDQDPYAKPQARIDILLLRQVDPEGKTVGADVFELVTRNSAAPVRLEYQPGSAVYETSFQANLDPKEKYALRVLSPTQNYWALVDVDGRPTYLSLRRENSRTTRPSRAPTLPALEKSWELTPRIFIETMGPAGLIGRMVFTDVATDAGTLGAPAETRSVMTVGAVDEKGHKRSYSAEGPPAYSDLGCGPKLYAPDALQLTEHGDAFGTSIAASLAAGWVAAVNSEAFERERVLHWLATVRGKRISGAK